MKISELFESEQNIMMEGDFIMFEGQTKALAGTIVSIDNDTIIIEGGVYPLEEDSTQLFEQKLEEDMMSLLQNFALPMEQMSNVKDMIKYVSAFLIAGYGKAAAEHAIKFTWTHIWKAIKTAYSKAKAALTGVKDAQKKAEVWSNFDDEVKDAIVNLIKSAVQTLHLKKKPNAQKPSMAASKSTPPAVGTAKMAPRRQPQPAIGESSEASDKVSSMLNSFGYYPTDFKRMSVVYNHEKNGDKIERVGSSWKHESGKQGHGADELGNFLSSKTGLNEAEYHGRKVQLGKPKRTPSGPKKFTVFVKNPKTGNIKKVNFGDRKMEIKRDDPKHRASFRARHKCDTAAAKDRTSARYWSCKFWSKKPVSKLT